MARLMTSWSRPRGGRRRQSGRRSSTGTRVHGRAGRCGGRCGRSGVRLSRQVRSGSRPGTEPHVRTSVYPTAELRAATVRRRCLATEVPWGEITGTPSPARHKEEPNSQTAQSWEGGKLVSDPGNVPAGGPPVGVPAVTPAQGRLSFLLGTPPPWQQQRCGGQRVCSCRDDARPPGPPRAPLTHPRYGGARCAQPRPSAGHLVPGSSRFLPRPVMGAVILPICCHLGGGAGLPRASRCPPALPQGGASTRGAWPCSSRPGAGRHGPRLPLSPACPTCWPRDPDICLSPRTPAPRGLGKPRTVPGSGAMRRGRLLLLEVEVTVRGAESSLL